MMSHILPHNLHTELQPHIPTCQAACMSVYAILYTTPFSPTQPQKKYEE